MELNNFISSILAGVLGGLVSGAFFYSMNLLKEEGWIIRLIAPLLIMGNAILVTIILLVKIFKS